MDPSPWIAWVLYLRPLTPRILVRCRYVDVLNPMIESYLLEHTLHQGAKCRSLLVILGPSRSRSDSITPPPTAALAAAAAVASEAGVPRTSVTDYERLFAESESDEDEEDEEDDPPPPLAAGEGAAAAGDEVALGASAASTAWHRQRVEEEQRRAVMQQRQRDRERERQRELRRRQREMYGQRWAAGRHDESELFGTLGRYEGPYADEVNVRFEQAEMDFRDRFLLGRERTLTGAAPGLPPPPHPHHGHRLSR